MAARRLAVALAAVLALAGCPQREAEQENARLIAQLRGERDELARQLDELRIEMNRERAKNVDLARRLTLEMREADAGRTRHNDAEQKLDQATRKLAALQAQCDSLAVKNQVLENSFNELRKVYEALRGQLDPQVGQGPATRPAESDRPPLLPPPNTQPD